jgi:PhnB protein
MPKRAQQRRGFHTITPSLSVPDAKAAVAFYAKALGATVIERHDEPDGKISNVILRIGDSPLMLSDDTSQHARNQAHEGWPRSPRPGATSSTAMYIYVPDADAVFERALKAGASVIAPVADQEWGDRLGGFRDPFGYVWNVATHVAELPH